MKRFYSGLLLILLSFSVFGQSLQETRKTILGARRKLKTEVNRATRDYKNVSRSLSSSKRTVDASVDTADVIVWSMSPYIPNSGMIHDYKYVYTFLHAEQEFTFQRDYDLKSIHWDSVNNVFYKNTGSRDRLQAGVEVIGWHPHWMGDAYKYYNYKLLSMISYYSYDINPYTGSYSNPEVIDQLRNSGLPDSAARYGTKALISVTSLERANNSRFLNNDDAQDVFFYQILQLLDEKKGKFSGIDLNFEEIDAADRDRFIHFVKQLNSRLATNNYFLILDVPYFNDGNVLDYRELAGHVKYFNVMGYDFHGVQSAYPGSISPLHALDTEPSLETAVNDLLIQGVLAQQIILSLPLYGVTWDISGLDRGRASVYEQSLPYFKIVSRYGTEYNPFYDPFSASFFFVMQDNNVKKMCWYENEISLGSKYQWAQSKGLKGIGLWALGYAQGAPEIWKGVADHFGVDSLVAITPLGTRLSGPYGMVKNIITYQKVIGMGFLVFAGFVVLGFVFSLTDWRVREVLFQKQSFRLVYSFTFLVFAIVGLEWWFGGSQSNLVVGLVVGASGVLLINAAFTKYRDVLK